MSVEDVETSSAYIDSCVHVMFCTSVFCRDCKNFFASVGDEGSLSTIIIYNMSRWELGTGVVEMFQWKAVLSIRAYIAGARTAPAQPLTPDWGHGTFLRARAKWFRKARRLKKLGRGSILGGFARSPTMVS